MVEYRIKTDDLLLKLLKDYHNIDISEAMCFFGDRAKEMLKSEPNITEKSRSPVTFYTQYNGVNKTITYTHKYKDKQTFAKHLNKMNIDGNRIYVLRGFYPETNLPFKMTLVKIKENHCAICKVTIGLKQHHTLITSEDICKYNDIIAEALLLNLPIKDNKYQYRKFKCMRPKGMSLYHEKRKTTT